MALIYPRVAKSEPVNQGQLSAVFRISVKRGASLAWSRTVRLRVGQQTHRYRPQRPTRSPEMSPKTHCLLILLIQGHEQGKKLSRAAAGRGRQDVKTDSGPGPGARPPERPPGRPRDAFTIFFETPLLFTSRIKNSRLETRMEHK